MSNPEVFSKVSFTTFVHFFLFLCLVVYGMTEFVPARGSNNLDINRTGEAWPEDAGKFFRFDEDAAVTMAVLAFTLSAHTTSLTIFAGIRFTEEEKKSSKAKEEVVLKIVQFSTTLVYFYYLFIAIGKSFNKGLR